MDRLPAVRRCFLENRVLYSRHARHEMVAEEFGSITDDEIAEAVAEGEIIESYPAAEPYPSVLIHGRTRRGRPVHVVAAYSERDNLCVVVTVYHPDPSRWIEYRRRRR